MSGYVGTQPKKVIPSGVAYSNENLGQVPLFTPIWYPSREHIPAGYVPADGQELEANLYPDAFAGISGGRVPIVPQAEWASTPAKRGCFVIESSIGKFRVPDYNGKSVGSLGAVFMRGDGGKSAGANGLIQMDALQGHWHETWYANGGRSGTTFTDGFDAPATLKDERGDGYARVRNPISDGVNGDARTASETRPLNVTGVWCIKLFGAVVNEGATDAAELASVVSSHASRISVLEDAPKPLGVGQTWQNVKASRAWNTLYTNTSGRPILVQITVYHTNNGASQLSVDGNIVSAEACAIGGGSNNNLRTTLTAVVGTGSTYRLEPGAPIQGTVYPAPTIEQWMEL